MLEITTDGRGTVDDGRILEKLNSTHRTEQKIDYLRHQRVRGWNFPLRCASPCESVYILIHPGIQKLKACTSQQAHEIKTKDKLRQSLNSVKHPGGLGNVAMPCKNNKLEQFYLSLITLKEDIHVGKKSNSSLVVFRNNCLHTVCSVNMIQIESTRYTCYCFLVRAEMETSQKLFVTRTIICKTLSR